MSGSAQPEQLAAMQDWLLHAAPGMPARIAGADDVERRHRLRIYADAYRWRLCQVLAEDYPALRATLGETAFERLAARYLAAHPSRHPSVRWLGAQLPGWLRDAGHPPGRIALARFEWAQGEVFDAPDVVPCGIATLTALAPVQWPRMRLRLVPALRLLEDLGNAPRRAAAAIKGGPVPRWRGDGRRWLIWRQELEVHWRVLPDDEGDALAKVAADACFADWCMALGGPDPAMRAASLLKRWLADGLVGAIDAPDASDPDPSVS